MKLYFLLIPLILCACAANKENISIDEMKTRITSGINLENGVVTDFNGNKTLGERYGISIAKIDGGFVYTNDESNEKADQIIVLHAVNRTSLREIEGSLEREITNISSAWEDVDEDEYKKIKNCVLKSNGQYVMLAIADKSKEAENIFNSFFD